MRILYVANYQGRAVVERRRLVRNRALGGSTKVETISRALVHLGHDVTVVSMGTPAERSSRVYGVQTEEIRVPNGSVRVLYLPAIDLPLLNVWSGRAAIATYLHWARRWDVALVYNLDSAALAAARRLHSLRIPIVFEYEDDACATLEKGPGGNPSGTKLLETARRLASGLVAVSDELALQFAAPHSLVVRGAVPDAAFDVPTRPFRQEEGPLRLLYAGGLTRPKGVEILLDALPLLHHDVQLTIVGTGPLAETVRRTAASSTHLTYEGEVSRARLEALLSHVHVCINPHLTDAGQSNTLFPFKLSEYIAYGAVVVSSPLGHLSADVSSAIAPYAPDAPDALAEAIDHVADGYAHFMTQMAAARRALLAEVSETSLGARIDALLQEITRK